MTSPTFHLNSAPGEVFEFYSSYSLIKQKQNLPGYPLTQL